MDPHFGPTKRVFDQIGYLVSIERFNWDDVGRHLFYANGLNRQILIDNWQNIFCPSDAISDLKFKVFKSLKL